MVQEHASWCALESSRSAKPHNDLRVYTYTLCVCYFQSQGIPAACNQDALPWLPASARDMPVMKARIRRIYLDGDALGYLHVDRELAT